MESQEKKRTIFSERLLLLGAICLVVSQPTQSNVTTATAYTSLDTTTIAELNQSTLKTTSQSNSESCGSSEPMTASEVHEKVVSSNVTCHWMIANATRLRIRLLQLSKSLLLHADVSLELNSSMTNVRVSWDNNTPCPRKENKTEKIPCLEDDSWTVMNARHANIFIKLTIVPHNGTLLSFAHERVQIGFISESDDCGPSTILLESSTFFIPLRTNISLNCVYYVKKGYFQSATFDIEKGKFWPDSTFYLSIYGGSSTSPHSAFYQSADFLNSAPVQFMSSNAVTTIHFILKKVDPSNWIKIRVQQSYSQSNIITADSNFDWIYSSTNYPALTMKTSNSMESWKITGSSSTYLEIHYINPQAYDDDAFSIDVYYDSYPQKPSTPPDLRITDFKGHFTTDCGQDVSIFYATTAALYFRGFAFWVKTGYTDVHGVSCSSDDVFDGRSNSAVAIAIGVVLGALMLFGMFILAVHFYRRKIRPSIVTESISLENRPANDLERSTTVVNVWQDMQNMLNAAPPADYPPILNPPPPYEHAITLPKYHDLRNNPSSAELRVENRDSGATQSNHHAETLEVE